MPPLSFRKCHFHVSCSCGCRPALIVSTCASLPCLLIVFALLFPVCLSCLVSSVFVSEARFFFVQVESKCSFLVLTFVINVSPATVSHFAIFLISPECCCWATDQIHSNNSHQNYLFPLLCLPIKHGIHFMLLILVYRVFRPLNVR